MSGRQGQHAVFAVLPMMLATAVLIGLAPPVRGEVVDFPARQAHYATTSWTERDGLPSSLIWAMTQDRDGYLWLGTDGGVFRFDGVRFAGWEDLGRPSLLPRPVRALLISRTGDVWIGYGLAGGISRLHEGGLLNYNPEDGVPDRPVQLLEDRSGTIWARGSGGLARFQGDHWERVSELPGARAMYEDRAGTMWVSSGSRVYRRLANQPEFDLFASNMAVRTMGEDQTGAIWFGGPSGVGRRGGQPSSLGQLRRLNTSVLLSDRDGELWVGTVGQGVWRVSEAHGLAPVVERVGEDPAQLSAVIRSLFEDKEGNIWVGTQHGLSRLSKNTIITMSSSTDVSRGIYAVAAAKDGSVWAGTEDGLYHFAGDRRRRFDQRDGLPSLAVWAVHSDGDGTTWVAMQTGGLLRLVGDRFVKAEIPPGRGLNVIWAMTRDFEGALWFCEMRNGVFRLKDGVLTSFDDLPEIKGKHGISILADSRRRVWIGFSDGTLVLYQNNMFRSYSQRDGLTGGSVAALLEDASGRIWVGTDKGLSRIDGDRAFSLPTRHGTPIQNVKTMIDDGNGAVWLGVGAGIVRLPASEFDAAVMSAAHEVKYRLYDHSDGLRGLPTSVRGYPSAARAADGTLWLVTSDGLAMLDPRRQQRMPAAPPVIIERVTADTQVVDTSADVRLPAGTAAIQIDYTGLSLAAPSKIHFRYRLEGLDTDWTNAGSRRQAYYTNLPPRSYRFHVIAENDGVWNEAGAVWRFSIARRFFQTLWFHVAWITVVLMALIVAWRFRVHQVHKQLSLVYGERVRVAREVHDTLLQSLMGIAFQFDTLSDELNTSPESARQRFQRLRAQVQMYVREARQSIWDLRSPMLRTQNLATALREIGACIVGDAVGFEVTVTGMARVRDPKVEEALLRIGQEAISNAVLHAQATNVRIDIAYEDDALILRFRDDGRGFDSSETGPIIRDHWGLANMRERARLIDAQFVLTSSIGKGTEIMVIAPLTSA